MCERILLCSLFPTHDPVCTQKMKGYQLKAPEAGPEDWWAYMEEVRLSCSVFDAYLAQLEASAIQTHSLLHIPFTHQVAGPCDSLYGSHLQSFRHESAHPIVSGL